MNAGARPRVGVLALTLELYETLAPGLRASREALSLPRRDSRPMARMRSWLSC
jgi:hypothetical protein